MITQETYKELTCNNFISKIIETNNTVTIFLISGVKLQGRILDHNPESFLMTQKNGSPKPQMIHKRSVATIALD